MKPILYRNFSDIAGRRDWSTIKNILENYEQHLHIHVRFLRSPTIYVVYESKLNIKTMNYTMFVCRH